MRPTAPRRLPLVAEQSGWRKYFYPETLEHADGVVQGTLRNLLGERDDERLAAAEYPLACYRAHQLRLDPALVTPPPDQRRPGPPGHPASCRVTRPRCTSHRPRPDPVGRVLLSWSSSPGCVPCTPRACPSAPSPSTPVPAGGRYKTGPHDVAYSGGLLRHLLPEHPVSLPGRPRSQGGGGGRVQVARQEPQGQGNGPEGERDPEQYRSPGPGRQCPCGCPRQVAQLKPPARGPIRLPPGGSPPLCPTMVTRVHYPVTGGHGLGPATGSGPGGGTRPC